MRHTDTPTPLSPRVQRFVEEYLVDLNGAAACRRAGYAPRHANRQATQLLARPAVRAALAARTQVAADQAEVRAVDVLRELLVLLKSDVRHYRVNVDSGALELADGAPDEAWRAVSSVKHRTTTYGKGSDERAVREIEFRLWSKPDAARMLGEYLKLYTQKHEVELPGASGVLAVPVPLSAEQWGAIAAAQQRELATRPAVAPAPAVS